MYCSADKAKGGSSVFVDGTDVKIIKKFAEEDPVTLTELLNTDAVSSRPPYYCWKLFPPSVTALSLGADHNYACVKRPPPPAS